MVSHDEPGSRDNGSLLRWAYFALVAVVAAAVLFLLYDLRTQVRRTSGTINQKLPEILDKTRTSADTLAALSEDIRQLRDLAGAPDQARDASLVAYADAVLDLIENSGGTIGVKEMLGDDLKDLAPAREWVVGARKEALWLTFRAKSKREVLERLCVNKFGSGWHLQPGAGGEPVLLLDWVNAHHPDSATISDSAHD